MAEHSPALNKRTIIEGLDLYVRRAELYRIPPVIVAECDPDDEVPLDFKFAPGSATSKSSVEVFGDGDHELGAPTAFMVDGIQLALQDRSLLEKGPLAVIQGYPRFGSEDDQLVTDIRDHYPDEELRGEVIVPHQDGGISLLGTMNVYLQGIGQAG